tara:strand:+ start:8221 stop:9399 length:1179 start_codon:yes stop_codon:yes gene_type:complete
VINVLNDIVILDASKGIAGPYSSMLLQNMGARVIKLEFNQNPKARNDVRYQLWNRGKEQFSINLKVLDSKYILSKLIKISDVIILDGIESELAINGLDYESIKKHNEQIIYCIIPPFPSTGPFKERKGNEYSVGAAFGLMGDQGDDGVPEFVRLPTAAYGAAFNCCYHITAALLWKELHNEGKKIEISLAHSAMVMQSAQFMTGMNLPSRKPIIRDGIRAGVPIYRLFKAKDGWFFLAGGNPSFWNKLCIGLELEELVIDERFIDAPWGIPNEYHLELAEIFEPIFKENTLDYWEEFMKITDIPFAKVGTKNQYIMHEQMSHNKTIEPFSNNNLGITKQISNIVYFDGAKTKVNPVVKSTGFDNYPILTEIGFTNEEIHRFITTNTIYSNNE